jgi:acyl-CoA thioesterase-2
MSEPNVEERPANGRFGATDATGAPIDVDALVEETIEYISVRPESDGWVGDAPFWFGDRLFGGFVVAQSVYAASSTGPPDKRIHSLHGYFLKPVLAGSPITYTIETVREGRSFSTRELVAVQDGAPVFRMACSFTADTEGYEYELPLGRDVPGPEELPTKIGPGPWEQAWAGPTDPAPDGTRQSTHRAWSRVARTLPDDPHLHVALVGFASDMTGVGGRPRDLDGDIRGMISLDHAVWFHREVRADEWMLYDVHSLVNTAGRGVLRGTLHDLDRRICASVAQEMRLYPYESLPA